MIYLICIFICLLVVFIIFANYILSLLLNINKNKKIYTVQQQDNKYFMLIYLLKIIQPLTSFLQTLQIKSIDIYSSKIFSMTKILSIPYIYLDGYKLIVLQFLLALISIVVTFLLIGYDLLIMICVAVLFFILPYLQILETYKRKKDLVLKQLPNLIDLLSVMVLSGIDFNNALIKISKIIDGVWKEEIETINLKINFGLSAQKAFDELAKKYNLVQIDMFVRTVNSTLESGLGMSESLNKISQQLKVENSSIAEKKAQEAPVKMLIPMTLLIFPTIFILLFAPIIIAFMKSGI